jgi:murein DD-endopeptidase MepM/ murein hydrolase activator NlpD
MKIRLAVGLIVAVVLFASGMAVQRSFGARSVALPIAQPVSAGQYEVPGTLQLPWPCGVEYAVTTTWDGHWYGDDEYPRPRSRGELPIDFGGAEGDPLIAPADGTLTRGADSGRGNFVSIDVGDGWTVQLFHLAEPSPVEDGPITRGTVLGRVGTTGESTAPHIHLALLFNGARPDIDQIDALYGYPKDAFGRGARVASKNCGTAGSQSPQPAATVDALQPATPSTPIQGSAAHVQGPADGTGGASPPPPPPPPPPPERVATIYNQVTNGSTEMREDSPAYLSTRTANYCRRDGCMVAGTEMNSGARVTLTCWTEGVRTTNGQDGNSIDDSNPNLYESHIWFTARHANGSTGWISEVWIQREHRGTGGLPRC